MRHPTTETRWPSRGAQIVVLGASRARSNRPADRAEATVKLTDEIIGDWPPPKMPDFPPNRVIREGDLPTGRRWSLERVRERIANSWVLTALVQSLLTWAIAAVIVVALWFALTFYLSL